MVDPKPSEQALMRDMGLNPASIERRKKFVGLGPEDLPHIAALRDAVLADIPRLANAFFQFLSHIDEARPLTSHRELVERARHMKEEHLRSMVSGEYGMPYVEQRVALALLFSRAGLDSRVMIGAFHHLVRTAGELVFRQSERGPMALFEDFTSLQKVSFFDIGIMIDVMTAERERVIRQQQEAIRELSTPVLQIRDRLLLLPIIGLVDSHRAQLITENLLRAIRANRAKVVVMDITGVATMDSKVANHLIQTIAAARLMGATVIVSGLSSEVAQSLVALGVELARVTTVGDLQGGLEDAEKILGYRITVTEPMAARV